MANPRVLQVRPQLVRVRVGCDRIRNDQLIGISIVILIGSVQRAPKVPCMGVYNLRPCMFFSLSISVNLNAWRVWRLESHDETSGSAKGRSSRRIKTLDLRWRCRWWGDGEMAEMGELGCSYMLWVVDFQGGVGVALRWNGE